ncbi:MAG: hypothetical protein GY930_13265 [bacterium]|nr:hypothetical protein [bacterium]
MSQDPIDALRQAWQNENKAMPSEDLRLTDDATRKTVKALQEAWAAEAQAPVPCVDLDLLARRAYGRGPKIRRRWQALAVASFAAAAALVLWWAPTGNLEPADGNDDSQLASASTDEGKAETNSPTTIAPESEAPNIRHLQPGEVVHRPDGIELVSGSVRLVLVHPEMSKPN